jgi:hypothetical protein
MTEMRNAYHILVGESKVKTPLGRCRRRWGLEDSIRMDLREIGVEIYGLDSFGSG